MLDTANDPEGRLGSALTTCEPMGQCWWSVWLRDTQAYKPTNLQEIQWCRCELGELAMVLYGTFNVAIAKRDFYWTIDFNDGFTAR